MRALVQVDERCVKEQTIERLRAIQPLLSEIMDVKLVVQPRKNMLNIRVKPEYVTLMWHKELDGVRYCFFMSDKLEPYIIVTALSASGSRCIALQRWNKTKTIRTKALQQQNKNRQPKNFTTAKQLQSNYKATTKRGKVCLHSPPCSLCPSFRLISLTSSQIKNCEMAIDQFKASFGICPPPCAPAPVTRVCVFALHPAPPRL